VALAAAPDDEQATALQTPLDVNGPLRRRADDRIDTVGHMAIIPYADEDPEDDRVRAVLDRLPDPKLNLFTMLANAPALIGPSLRLGEAILTRSDLPAQLRELAILRSASATDTEYEWVQHEAIAKLIGVPVEKIAAVRSGDLDALEAAEAAAMRLVEQSIGTRTPEEALVREVAEHYGRNGLIELLLVAGYYAMLGGVMRAVRIDVDSVLDKGIIDAQQLR
jgi:4-carboxymuconolactone decarboxylase